MIVYINYFSSFFTGFDQWWQKWWRMWIIARENKNIFYRMKSFCYLLYLCYFFTLFLNYHHINSIEVNYFPYYLNIFTPANIYFFYSPRIQKNFNFHYFLDFLENCHNYLNQEQYSIYFINYRVFGYYYYYFIYYYLKYY